jgi:hypothetical protein
MHHPGAQRTAAVTAATAVPPTGSNAACRSKTISLQFHPAGCLYTHYVAVQRVLAAM